MNAFQCCLFAVVWFYDAILQYALARAEDGAADMRCLSNSMLTVQRHTCDALANPGWQDVYRYGTVP